MTSQNSADDPGRQVRARIMTLLTKALTAGPAAEASGDGAHIEPLFLRLCRVFVEATAASGGTLTMAPNEMHRMTLCATDGTAARLENLQEVIGQGPVADAATSGRVVTADLGSASGAERWPILSSTVADDLGMVTVHAFPLRVGEQTVGVASVYRRFGEDLWKPPVEEASLLADMIGSAIASTSLGAETGLTRDVRDRISQATGMVIAQLGIGPEDALALLRAAAFSGGLEMGQISTEILEYRLDFSSTEHDFGGDDR